MQTKILKINSADIDTKYAGSRRVNPGGGACCIPDRDRVRASGRMRSDRRLPEKYIRRRADRRTIP